MERTKVPRYSNENFQTGNAARSSQDSDLTLSPTSCFKQEHHHIYLQIPLVYFFPIQQKQVRHPMYMQKLLLAVLCGQCWLHMSHLPCLLPPTEYTGISIWTPHCCCQHWHSKRSNLQPWSHRCFWHRACSYLSPHRALFTLSKHSETFNLPMDCPLVCPQGRGMKSVIIKKEQKPPTASFPLCSVRNMPKWSDSSRGWNTQRRVNRDNSPGSRSLNGARHEGMTQHAFPLYVVI